MVEEVFLVQPAAVRSLDTVAVRTGGGFQRGFPFVVGPAFCPPLFGMPGNPLGVHPPEFGLEDLVAAVHAGHGHLPNRWITNRASIVITNRAIH